MIENVNFPLAVLRPSVWELCSRSCELLYKSPGVYKVFFYYLLLLIIIFIFIIIIIIY